MRRPFALPILMVVVVVVGGIWLRNYRSLSAPPSHKGVAVSSWNSAIGAVNSHNSSFDEQKLTFEATVWNDSNQTAYVRTVAVNLPTSLRNHVLSGTPILSVNRSLKPNGYVTVKGYFVLDTKGMSKEQIVNLGGIQGFTVNTKH